MQSPMRLLFLLCLASRSAVATQEAIPFRLRSMGDEVVEAAKYNGKEAMETFVGSFAQEASKHVSDGLKSLNKPSRKKTTKVDLLKRFRDWISKVLRETVLKSYKKSDGKLKAALGGMKRDMVDIIQHGTSEAVQEYSQGQSVGTKSLVKASLSTIGNVATTAVEQVLSDIPDIVESARPSFKEVASKNKEVTLDKGPEEYQAAVMHSKVLAASVQEEGMTEEHNIQKAAEIHAEENALYDV